MSTGPRHNDILALRTQIKTLRRQGRDGEALAVAREAMAQCLRLPRQLSLRDLGLFSGVAEDLVHGLIGLEDTAGAVAACREVVGRVRTATDVEETYRLLTLARWLSVLACDLEGHDAGADELGTAVEAVRIRRALYTQDPAPHRDRLAEALGRLAQVRAGQGRPAEAETAFAEATWLLREPAPAGVQAVPQAETLIVLRTILSRLGRRSDAAAVSGQVVQARHRELSRAPVDEGYWALALAWHDYAERVQELGDRSQTYAALREAVVAAREPVRISPDRARAEGLLAGSLTRAMRGYATILCLDEARNACHEALTLRWNAPEPRLFELGDLMVANGRFLDLAGDRANAVPAVREAVGFLRKSLEENRDPRAARLLPQAEQTLAAWLHRA
jgi:tetratricopeptide (TPR) repeat protein